MGFLDVDAMLEHMPSRLFHEWLAFNEVDPFGDQRADLRSAIIAATMSNRWRGKHERQLKPLDFMPYRNEPEQTPEDMQRILEGVLGACGG